MTMPGRNTNNDAYRYAYNGMEVDNEVKGNGNSYTTEFRQYDPRLGRWLSLDPLMMMFPDVSPYCAFDNNPVYYTDPYGLAPGNGDDGIEDGEKTYQEKAESLGLPSNPEIEKAYKANNGGYYSYDGERWSQTTSEENVVTSRVYGINPNATYVLTKDGFVENAPYEGFKISGKDLITMQTMFLYKQMADEQVNLYYEEQRLKNEQTQQAARDVMYYQNIFCLLYEFSGVSTVGTAIETYQDEGLAMATLAVVLDVLPGEADNILRAARKIQKHHLIPNQIFREFKLKQLDKWNQNHKNNLLELPVPFHGNHPQYNTYVRNQLNKMLQEGGITFEKLVELQNQLRQAIMELDHFGTSNLNDSFRGR